MRKEKVKINLEICNCKDCPYCEEELRSLVPDGWDYDCVEVVGIYCALTEEYVDGHLIDENYPLEEV